MSVYDSKQFKDLDLKWKARLKESGFDDKESGDRLENRKQDSKRFRSVNQTLEFFLMLDCYLSTCQNMPRFERCVLSLYSKGFRITKIMKELKTNRINVKRVLERYRIIVKTILAMRTMSQTDVYMKPESLEAKDINGSLSHKTTKEIRS